MKKEEKKWQDEGRIRGKTNIEKERVEKRERERKMDEGRKGKK